MIKHLDFNNGIALIAFQHKKKHMQEKLAI